MRLTFRLLLLALVISVSGCVKTVPWNSGVVKGYDKLKYRVNFQSNADWFAITLDMKGSDARFVLPDNPGIWIKDPQDQTSSVKLSTTTLHIHRHRSANADMNASNFYVESSSPAIIVRVDHGANGRVIIRSDCDAFTTGGTASQTFRLKLCRQ